MTLSVDLFFSFRSPYSYLALPKTLRIVKQYDLVVNARPVYPLAVRVPGFFKKANPNFARYVFIDSIRVAQMENIPFRFPQPDPIDQNMMTLEVAAEQPRIKRLTRLGAAAQDRHVARAQPGGVLLHPNLRLRHLQQHLDDSADGHGLARAEVVRRVRLTALDGEPIALHHVADVREVPLRLEIADAEDGLRAARLDGRDLAGEAADDELR
mgnify:CR=1 FL=1